MSISISRALRNRKTARNKVATLSDRIRRFAVVLEDTKPDFLASDLLEEYESALSELRQLKMDCIRASVNTMVQIPVSAPVVEAGTRVPVYMAVLIRDDLKNRKAVLDQIINTSVDPQRAVSRFAEAGEVIKKVRTFDFALAMKESERIQDAIDELDGLVQATDATTKI